MSLFDRRKTSPSKSDTPEVHIDRYGNMSVRVEDLFASKAFRDRLDEVAAARKREAASRHTSTGKDTKTTGG